MARLLDRTLVVSALMLIGLASAGVTGAMGTLDADAQSCLPSPNALLGAVARTAGTDSGVWADTQQVQQADAAQGTDTSGKVIQDLLDVVQRDGYQFDCASGRLTALPGAAHPASPITSAPTTTPSPGPTSSPHSQNLQAPDTAISGSPPTVSPVAGAANTNGSSGTHIPKLLLILLVLGSVALIVVAVRRQMARR